MKCKAAVNEGIPDVLRRILDGRPEPDGSHGGVGLRERILSEVLKPHLKVDPARWGPAEFYLQHCDEGVSGRDGFCEVRLSGVSKTDDRAPNDFRHARQALENIYAELIRKYLPSGKRVQLFVSLMLDQPLSDEERTTLVEGDPIWIEGAAAPA
jgi:hypothetical protein